MVPRTGRKRLRSSRVAEQNVPGCTLVNLRDLCLHSFRVGRAAKSVQTQVLFEGGWPTALGNLAVGVDDFVLST